jgi:predicted nucleic acid-binding protein
MNVEFIDTNILVYAHDSGAGPKYDISASLLARLFDSLTGALSVQVLSEFYSVATRKLGIQSEEAEAIISDLGGWAIHRPSHADVLQATRLHRRYKLTWWDAMIVQSSLELNCSVLWSEDFSHAQQYGSVRVQNPFH